MNPAPALCEVCSAYVPEWAWTQNPDPDLNTSYCDDSKNDTWLFFAGADESDLITCCNDAHDQEAVDPCTGGCDFSGSDIDPVPKTKSCLYNKVMNCLGIYTPPSGWPLPTPYPSDPPEDC